MIAGLVSCYMEGDLATSAIRSLLPAVDCVLVLDAPVEGQEQSGRASNFQPFVRNQAVIVQRYAQPFDDDAAKRTWLLKAAQKKRAEWVVIVDADEVLLWGEYLRDWIQRAAQEGYDAGAPIAGVPMRIVELDGSTAFLRTRILRASLFKRYLASSSALEATDGTTVALGNEQVTLAGGWPLPPPGQPSEEEMLRWLARYRPPLQGEPHLLHRSLLRDRSRTIERQHLAEARAFERIWTP